MASVSFGGIIGSPQRAHHTVGRLRCSATGPNIAKILIANMVLFVNLVCISSTSIRFIFVYKSIEACRFTKSQLNYLILADGIDVGKYVKYKNIVQQNFK